MRGQDFEKAGQLRDREMELKAKISAIIAGAKETSKAEAESVEGGGPQVRVCVCVFKLGFRHTCTCQGTAEVHTQTSSWADLLTVLT